jgi:hypothetical protein
LRIRCGKNPRENVRILLKFQYKRPEIESLGLAEGIGGLRRGTSSLAIGIPAPLSLS